MLIISSGSETEPLAPVPFLIISTYSMPEVTSPQTVYCPSSHGQSAKQIKNWLSAESGIIERAIETVPRLCGVRLNSAFSFLPLPPVPVP